MTDRFEQLRAVTLALLMVASLFAVANVATAAPGDPDTYAVKQGGECWEVTPMGDGTQNVSEFYDYRYPNSDPPANDYASHGTDEIQENQVSQLFLYNGSEGVSLVMLHDKRSDGPHGSTITFDISGLPTDNEWVVEDDDYGQDTDDNFSHSGTQSTIDWVWAKHRTDGAAVRGLESDGYNAVQINPGFNEDANRWDTWPYAGDADNRTQAWKLIQNPSVANSPGDKVVFPSMTQSVTIEQGGCPDTTSPTADLSAPDTVEEGEEFTFDASGSSDDEGIVSYEWDFNGNGTVDATTTDATVNHSYAQNGTYQASVTVTDDAGNTDTANVSITVTEPDDQPPSADLEVSPSEAEAGDEVTFDASNSTDNGNIAEYRWDFDSDGSVDDTTSSATTTYTYDQTNEYDASVTVVDTSGNSDTANATVNVSDTTPPVTSADVPDQVVKNTTFEVDGSASSDNGQIASYEWDFGNNTTKSGAIASHSYAENGTYNVTLTVTDASGNTNSTTDMVTVTNNDTMSPSAALDAPRSAAVGDNVTLDASGSSDDGDIVEYRWDFDADGSVDDTTSSATTQHSYDSTGDYNATVTVVDSSGKNDSATQMISVTESGNMAPNAAITGPEKGHATDPVTFDASGSSDADGNIVQYQWDFGSDGEIDRNTSSPKVSWTYTTAGKYNASVTVVDDDGATDTATTQIFVQDFEPQVDVTPDTATVMVDEKVCLDLSQSSDDRGIKYYEFDWDGDGTYEVNSTKSFKSCNSFASAGTYKVNVQVTDWSGKSNSTHATITVNAPSSGGNGGGNPGGGNTGGGDTSDDDPKTDIDDSKDGIHVDVDDAKGDQPFTVELPTGTQTGDGLTAYESITVTLIQDGDYDMTLNAFEEPPEGVDAPTVESVGFEPLSYLVVDHPDLSDDEIADAEFTFTIQQDRLDALDADASDVQIYRYDDGSWATVDTAVVEETDDAVRFRASDDGLSTFVVAIDRPSVALTDLSVSQDSIAPGESVEITATIENNGRASDTTAVELGVDGETVDTRDLTMGANSERSITFERTFSEPGTHTVSVNGQEIEVMVQSETTATVTPEETPATPDDGQPGFGLVLAALAMLGAALLALRRR